MALKVHSNRRQIEMELPRPRPIERIDAWSDIPVTIEARLDERLLDVRTILAMRPDTVTPLNRPAGETLAVFVGNVFLASAEVIVIEEHLALRITEFERLES